MKRAFYMAAITSGLMLIDGVPAAASEPTAAPFAAEILSDAQLASIRGGFPDRRYVTTMTDVQARDDFRQTGGLGTLLFDNWFNDVGSVLIVNAVLNAPR